MKIIKKEVVFEGKFIRVIAKHFKTKEGKKGIWEMVERKIPQKKAVVIFALTKESVSIKRKSLEAKSGLEAKYRGQASEDFQNEFYGGLKDKTVAEGIDTWGEVSGSAVELINSLLGGIRSGMTYGGARSIKELQRKAAN